MAFTDDTPVRIVNNDERDFYFYMRPPGQYATPLRYEIKSGETVFWTWRVARYWLGNPFLVNDERVPHLTNEVKRAQGLFGKVIYPETYRSPDVEVYGMDGERIHMAIEQAERGVPIAESLDSGTLQARIAAMEAELELLRANTAEPAPLVHTDVDPAEAATQGTSLDDLPADTTTATGPVGPVPTPRLSGQPRDTPLRAPSDLSDLLPE